MPELRPGQVLGQNVHVLVRCTTTLGFKVREYMYFSIGIKLHISIFDVCAALHAFYTLQGAPMEGKFGSIYGLYAG